MSRLADQVAQSNLAERIFSEGQLGDLLGGGDARRYALVNRALKDGSLIRLKRATYMLGQRNGSEAVPRTIDRARASRARNRRRGNTPASLIVASHPFSDYSMINPDYSDFLHDKIRKVRDELPNWLH